MSNGIEATLHLHEYQLTSRKLAKEVCKLQSSRTLNRSKAIFIEGRLLLTALFALSWLASFAQPTAEHLNTAIRAVIGGSRSNAYSQFLDEASIQPSGSTFQISPRDFPVMNDFLFGTGKMDPKVMKGILKCDQYEGATAGEKIQSCIEDLPSSGGVADARGIKGAQVATATITISRPAAVLLGDITLSVTASPAIDITAPEGDVYLLGTEGHTTITGTSLTMSVTEPMVRASYFGKNQASGVVVEGMKLVGGSSVTNCYKKGIQFRNVTKGAIRRNSISQIDSPEGAGGDAYSIQVADGSSYIDIENNTVIMAEPLEVGSSPFKIGILLQSPMVDAANGLFTGRSPILPNTKYINVRNNYVYGGTHGINPQNVAWVTVSGNRVERQGHRNIILYSHTNEYITVAGNIFYHAGSCNLIGSGRHISIIRNTFDTTLGGEGNNIESYYGNDDWIISGNYLRNAANSGIRLGYKIKRFTITGNHIHNFSTVAKTGYAGIKIEGAMGVSYPDTIAGGGSMEDITIAENTIGNTLPDAHVRAGIYVLGKDSGTVQGNTPFKRVYIGGNTIEKMHYGVRLKKNGNLATWKVNVRRNKCHDVTQACENAFD